MHELNHIITDSTFQRAVASGLAKKSLATFDKVTITAVATAREKQLQFAYHYPTGIIHKHYPWPDGVAAIERLMGGYFKQLIVETDRGNYHVLSNKKGHIKIVG